MYIIFLKCILNFRLENNVCSFVCLFVCLFDCLGFCFVLLCFLQRFYISYVNLCLYRYSTEHNCASNTGCAKKVE